GTKPEKTDSIMVLTYNPDKQRVVMTSIPRDTAIDYACKNNAGKMNRGKINKIYPSSGNKIDCLKDSVSNFLNIPIDHYIKVNMDQLKDIIDSIGSVKIKVHAQDGSLTQINVNNTQTYSWVDGDTEEMKSDEALTYA